jgi:putative flippase GtrA
MVNKLRIFLDKPQIAPFVQFIKFGIVGVSNTAISYVIEMLCFYVIFKNTAFVGIRGALSVISIVIDAKTARIWVASILAFVVSVTNSYYWNNKKVFPDGHRKTIPMHIKAYMKAVACYALTGLVLSPWLKTIMTEHGIQYWIASILTLVISVPLNFIMNKFWAFRKK